MSLGIVGHYCVQPDMIIMNNYTILRISYNMRAYYVHAEAVLSPLLLATFEAEAASPCPGITITKHIMRHKEESE